tara:strand:- start:302 stop:496 length:195 start_codon:yes stop_codon:yes gene_type:complete
MKHPSISLKRTLDVTINDIYLKIQRSSDKDSQALKEEYKEWLEAREVGNKHPHVLYMNQVRLDG